MRGILYGVGVGPGDPELMTIKAVRLIRENAVFLTVGDPAIYSTFHYVQEIIL